MRFILLFFALTLTAHAEEDTLSTYELSRPDTKTIEAVGKFYGLEHRRGDDYELVVPAKEAAFFLSLAPRARLKEFDTAAAAQLQLRSFGALAQGYRSLQEVQSWMQTIAESRPQLASVIEYGKSAAGRPLLALRINEGVEPKPVLMLTAATHGDELITTEVMMGLVDRLLAGYGSDERFTQMIRRHDLYFVPVVNVDGFVSTRRFDGMADPNRSYPYPGFENAKPTASIAGIIELFEQIKPVGSIDFHAFGEMIMYPWAYTYDHVDSASKARFHKVTSEMATTNRYAYGPIAEVIYVAKGSSADYYFWKSGTQALAIEIGRSKIPNPTQIPAYVESQAESTWRFIESF